MEDEGDSGWIEQTDDGHPKIEKKKKKDVCLAHTAWSSESRSPGRAISYSWRAPFLWMHSTGAENRKGAKNRIENRSHHHHVDVDDAQERGDEHARRGVRKRVPAAGGRRCAAGGGRKAGRGGRDVDGARCGRGPGRGGRSGASGGKRGPFFGSQVAVARLVEGKRVAVRVA
jgi:hypothetical protein